MILEPMKITWQIQKVQNYCRNTLQTMHFIEFDFIVQKKFHRFYSDSRLQTNDEGKVRGEF